MSGDNTLTKEELQWMDDLLAQCRKEGVMPRNRFELASYAIVSKGNVKKAMARLKKIRAIEVENRLDEIDINTAGEVAEKCSRGCFKPSGHDQMGRPIYFMDYAAFKPEGFQSDFEWSCLVKVSLDSFAGVTSTIKELRDGIVVVAASKNMGWKNFSFEMEKRLSGLYQDGYPIKIKSMYMTDPPSIISAIIKLLRLFMKKKIADRIVCCASSDLITGKIGGFALDQLPPDVGGSFQESSEEWMGRVLKRREESERELGPIPDQ